MAEVAVAIPTFRRVKGLERLLNALAALETKAKVHIVVADNDAERHEGFDLCRTLRARGYRWRIDAVIVPERGIAQARNAAVMRALSTDAHFIAMLADDEWPEPGCLAAFLAAQRGTGAIDMIESSSNVLMTRGCVAALAEPWFDPAFALTGGEDRDFFTRLKR